MSFILTTPISSGGSGASLSGLDVSVINGQPMLTLVDTTRSDKVLSVAENNLVFSENVLQHNDWIQIGTAKDADSAYVADFDATIVFASGMCENVKNNDKNIELYVNNINKGIIGIFSGSTLDTFINTTLDIDINRGDTVKLRAVDGNNGRIQDTVIKITLKWRK